VSGPTRKLADLARFSPEKMQKVPVFEAAGMLCDVYCLAPGQGQKVHAHAGSDKVVLCISGHLTAILGDEEHALPPGTAIHAPPSVPHGLRNDGAIEAVAYVVTAPRP
jgi:quercetin dioxygenase-like cupin family protein